MEKFKSIIYNYNLHNLYNIHKKLNSLFLFLSKSPSHCNYFLSKTYDKTCIFISPVGANVLAIRLIFQ